MRLPILIKRKTKQKIMMLYAVLEKCYPKKMKFHILFFGRGGGGQFNNNYWCDSELHHLLGRTPVGYIHRTCEDQVYR